MRYGDDNSVTVDESHIMAQLRQITPNISDCFIIDQLLFLEKQADIDKNSWIWSVALQVCLALSDLL